MKIEFETSEVLSEYEIKECAKEAVKEEIKKYFKNTGSLSDEYNTARLIMNVAHQFIFDEVHKIIPDYENQIAEGIKKIIKKADFSYQIWKKKDRWQLEDGFGTIVLEDESRKNEELIRQKVREVIANYNYDNAVKEKMSELVYEIGINISNLGELLQPKNT